MSEPPAYPTFVCELLESCPQSPNGTHQWLYRVARLLRRYHTDDQICAILAAKSAHCGRRVSHREIADSVQNAGICKEERRGVSALERRTERLAEEAR
jgi:hypothetical protein